MLGLGTGGVEEGAPRAPAAGGGASGAGRSGGPAWEFHGAREMLAGCWVVAEEGQGRGFAASSRGGGANGGGGSTPEQGNGLRLGSCARRGEANSEFASMEEVGLSSGVGEGPHGQATRRHGDGHPRRRRGEQRTVGRVSRSRGARENRSCENQGRRAVWVEGAAHGRQRGMREDRWW